MHTDPIADYLTRIRNAVRAGHKRVDIPASTLKREMTKILLEQKYIARYSELKDNPQGTIRIFLKYQEDKSVLKGLTRVSKPGRRVYTDHENLPRVLGGLGVAIISTPKGLMTDREAKRQKVGGEVLCYVW
jgi:small subunit ribosomal protein S8